MKTTRIHKTLIAAVLGVALAAGANVYADGNDRDHDHGGENHARYKTVENQLYKQECSACHYLYLPGLLPARSWEALIKGSDTHFGENLALDEGTSSEILGFLKANSAEKTNTEWSNKIMKSVGSSIPTRIMDVPWVIKEHRKVKDAFKRPSVKSASNCGACHTRGDEGDFETVNVPK